MVSDSQTSKGNSMLQGCRISISMMKFLGWMVPHHQPPATLVLPIPSLLRHLSRGPN